MTKLIDIKMKNIYRNKPSEDEGARARRIQAEQSLKNAWMKYQREAAKADGVALEKWLDGISRGAPWEGKEEELKLLLGRAEREVDRLLAVHKANEVAHEMVRVRFAVFAAKPKTKSSKGRKKS